MAGQPLKPQGGTSLGGVTGIEVWGIGGRCTGAPGGVEEEGRVGLLAVVGLVEFWRRPVSA